MKKTVRKVLIVILALVFLTSVAVLLVQQRTYRAGEEIYDRAEQIAQLTPEQAGQIPQPSETGPTPLPSVSAAPSDEPQPQQTEQTKFSLESLSLEALQQVGADVIGWIKIPDTVLSYPLVQGEDNDHYLDHAWDGTPTPVGAIFMDNRCAADLSDFHTLIYGHRMRNGTMFTPLDYYESQSFWRSHPCVYIKTGEGIRTYAVFAAYEAPVRCPVYDLTLSDDAAKQTLIDFALEQTVIDTGITPTVSDRILTLSTCTGRGYETRWVVQAVLLPEGAQP